MPALISVENVSMSYGGKEVIKDVSFAVPAKEIFVLFGGSGSGKSILVRIIAGLESPTRGRVMLLGQDINRLTACALLCASSGGGKTTLTAALIRRGWKTLGDDKLLLGLDEAGDPVLLSLINNFNLHPNTRRWFPEVGDLSVLPRYSAWTEKRKVRVEDIWPESMLEKAWPTHLIEIHRRNGKSGLSIEGLDTDQLLSVLLRQTVIPHEPNVAREILSALTATAPRLCGVKLVIGESAYRDDSCLAALEDALL